jgi:hypothetical protein
LSDGVAPRSCIFAAVLLTRNSSRAIHLFKFRRFRCGLVTLQPSIESQTNCAVCSDCSLRRTVVRLMPEIAAIFEVEIPTLERLASSVIRYTSRISGSRRVAPGPPTNNSIAKRVRACRDSRFHGPPFGLPDIPHMELRDPEPFTESTIDTDTYTTDWEVPRRPAKRCPAVPRLPTCSSAASTRQLCDKTQLTSIRFYTTVSHKKASRFAFFRQFEPFPPLPLPKKPPKMRVRGMLRHCFQDGTANTP